MSIPEGYLPRKGDVVLIKARAKRDAYPDSDRENASIQCYFEVVGHEGGTNFFVKADEIHSLYARNWNVGDMVFGGGTAFGDDLNGPAEVLAVDGSDVWVRDVDGVRWTVEANQLAPYVAPDAAETLSEAELTSGTEPFSNPAAKHSVNNVLDYEAPPKHWPEAPGGALDEEAV